MRPGHWLVMLVACASVPASPSATDLGPTTLARGTRCVADHCDVRRALADSIVRALRDDRDADLPRIVPALDRQDGVKLYAIRPGSLFERLGFRNGDVIRAVDGVALVAARLRTSLEPLAERTAHTIEVDRGGDARTLTFSIVDW